jgi:putative transcriptional regulator
MPTKGRANARLTKELLQTANHMHTSGVIDEAAHHKITMRHLGVTNAIPKVTPITGEDIRKLREKAQVSQAVFARYLNLTVGYVSQLERGTKRPTGAALAMLNVIRRKGIEAIL